MTKNITLITTIVITAATASAGTYFLTSNGQPDTNQITTANTQSTDQNPVALAVNQPPNKPIEIIVKTEIIEKHDKTDHIGSTRNLTQPQYVIGDGPGK